MLAVLDAALCLYVVCTERALSFVKIRQNIVIIIEQYDKCLYYEFLVF